MAQSCPNNSSKDITWQSYDCFNLKPYFRNAQLSNIMRNFISETNVSILKSKLDKCINKILHKILLQAPRHRSY